MTRTSAFRGTWEPNRRPYVVLAPDAYVALQGETEVIACGECRRQVDLNKYVTGISTEMSIDSPPGSATVTMSVPDTDVNDFYVEGELIIISMMEIEIFAKGYYTVGGTPQYYRVFWGLVSSVTKSWSNGVTTISLSCKDILYWWHLTNFATNAAFTDSTKTQNQVSFWGNHLAGLNPYTVILVLAKEAMGDFSITQGSFLSFRPEYGAEQGVMGQYAKDIMAYWQLKFGNIWNSLVLFGSSGQSYSFTGLPGNVSPVAITKEIFEQENKNLAFNAETAQFKIDRNNIVAFKKELQNAPGVNFFQTESQTKLQIALTARDQAGGYEFYCDPTGDIVFKPPFYNLNVLPNKPVSWIQDFEVMDDSITDTEQDVYTHITSHGDAFSGGGMSYGLNSDITTPQTGVIDWHLLKRYGWRRLDVQIEWTANARALFFHLLDQIDKINSKRVNGTVTIPMRPEIRPGFPVWFPKYDSFFYIQGISHQFSPGGQATTTLTLTAKRSKFIAPKNIGTITRNDSVAVTQTDSSGKASVKQEPTYSIDFPSNVAATIGLSNTGQEADYGGPMVLRSPKTGKILGFPNAVMVYRQTLSGEVLSRIIESSGSTKGHKPTKQDAQKSEGTQQAYNQVVGDIFAQLYQDKKNEIVQRLRQNRYEAGMTNAGVYDYAHDVKGEFLEFSIVPTSRITWGAGLGPDAGAEDTQVSTAQKNRDDQDSLSGLLDQQKGLLTAFKDAKHAEDEARRAFAAFKKKNPPKSNELSPEARQSKTAVDLAAADTETARKNLADNQRQVQETRARLRSRQSNKLTSLNIMVRPVSDEFGFEVIGHYRYGRGVFIDRGQVRIPAPGEASAGATVNGLNIQFAAHGGLLTDNPVQSNLGLESTSFAQAYESMAPEEYATAASFKGAQYEPGQAVQNYSITDKATYDDAINVRTKAGSAVFTEADAVRRALTLSELQPTISSGLDAVGYNRCACSLSKTSWLTVLPLTVVRQILGPVAAVPEGVSADAAAAAAQADQEPTDQGGVAGVVGQTAFQQDKTDLLNNQPLGSSAFTTEGAKSFFDALHDYLVSKFNADYSSNQKREQFDINGGRNVVRPGDEQTNILGDPQGGTFQRAAMGDPAALKQLQGDVNFNFGQTKQASREFKDTFSKGGPQDQLSAAISGLPGSIWDATKGGLIPANGISAGTGPSSNVPAPGTRPQYQPPGRIPKIGETINPGVGPNTPDPGFRPP